jgi:hypothetical protein
MKNQHHPAPLNFREQRMFHLALYDLDGFREHLRAHGIPEDVPMSAETPEEVLADDVKLLAFGHAWIKRALFGEAATA